MDLNEPIILSGRLPGNKILCNSPQETLYNVHKFAVVKINIILRLYHLLIKFEQSKESYFILFFKFYSSKTHFCSFGIAWLSFTHLSFSWQSSCGICRGRNDTSHSSGLEKYWFLPWCKPIFWLLDRLIKVKMILGRFWMYRIYLLFNL